MSSIRVALRIAARDALAHKLRSALVMVLVGLPVLVVTAGLVVLRTSEVSDVEALERDLGNADAYVQFVGGAPVDQDVSPFRSGSWWTRGDESPRPGGEVDLTPLDRVLGADTRLLPLVRGGTSWRTADGESLNVSLREVDLRDELAAPLFEVTEGRLPAGTDEVVVNRAVVDAGYGLGDVLPVREGETPTVVGVGEDAARLGAVAYGLPGSLVTDGPTRWDENETGWLVETGAVSWDDVRALNEAGFVVASRAVIEDRPAAAVEQERLHHGGGLVGQDAAVVGLIAVMVLLEVALLAGPAFAVTARRQARTLALVATAGGTPAQARRVVVAQGALLGAGASVAGVVLGVPAGLASTPLFQLLDGWTRFGPVDVPWLWIAGVAVCGVLSVLAAAVFPAWVTARQDPVAALAGRRSDPSPRLRHPLVGLALVGLGVAGTFFGTTRAHQGEWIISASTVVVVLGLILFVPVLLVALAKAVAGLPFAVRFAARDAARHRTRTVPAVVAVAATVAGVVALGISAASERAYGERSYDPMAAPGSTSVNWDAYELVRGDEPLTNEQAMARMEPLVTRVAGQEPVRLQGLLEPEEPNADGYESWHVLTDPSQKESGHLRGYGGRYGATILVSDDVRLLALDEEQADEAAAALAAGKVVVPTHEPVEADTVVLRRTFDSYEEEIPEGESARTALQEAVLPAHYLLLRGEFDVMPPMRALVPTAVAEANDLPATTVSLHLPDGIDEDDEEVLRRTFEAEGLWGGTVATERGFVDYGDTSVALLVMGLGAAALMLVGTLTATFLALSDARGDLATLGAVGGEPRVRRRVAGAYALLVAGAGAVLGAVIGVVPGIAVPVLERQNNLRWMETFGNPVPLVVDVPWLLVLSVLVGLPLLTAGVMWVSARSRLPMVARVE